MNRLRHSIVFVSLFLAVILAHAQTKIDVGTRALGQLPVANGGTAAATAANALTNLGAAPLAGVSEWTVTPLATPVNAAFTTATTGGSLAPGTYYYRVAATDAAGTSLPSVETSKLVPAGTSTNTVTVNWSAVTNATGYKVYGRSTGAELLIATVSDLTYVDTGSITPSGALPTANTTGFATAQGFLLQTLQPNGPPFQYFDDFDLVSNWSILATGSPTGDSCTETAAVADQNHVGLMAITSGAVSGAGLTCAFGGNTPAAIFINSSPGWKYETDIYLNSLPGTTAATYQMGLIHGNSVTPWATGANFLLASTNSVVNDWYCANQTSYTDSGVAAVAGAWNKFDIISDGTNVRWYINNTQVCSAVGVGSMSGSSQLLGYNVVAGTTTSVSMYTDYVILQRNVTR